MEVVVLVGVPKEIKNHEYRVGLTPASVRELTHRGVKVIIEKNAGRGAGFGDGEYTAAGAAMVDGAEEIFARADMVIKVKEPQPGECAMLRQGQTLFAYLHLASDHAQAEALMASGVLAIAYETVTDGQGRLPLLAPMSEVAGRMSIQVGAHCLEKAQGGAGLLLGGVPGVEPAKVVIIGGGTAGTNAGQMAVGLGADVAILDNSGARLGELDVRFQGRVKTVYSNRHNIERQVRDADLLIGSVLVPGAAAAKLVSRGMIRAMGSGSVVVDISIDQGGCFETSRPTTHDDPTYVEEGVVHYCVTNIPGAVPRTSTLALNNATLPYVIELATKGSDRAIGENIHLARGVNVWHRAITHAAVAEALGKPLKALPLPTAA